MVSAYILKMVMLTSFLQNILQIIKYGNFSLTHSVSIQVYLPQVDHSPLNVLFVILIFINDISYLFKYSNILLFAFFSEIYIVYKKSALINN